MPTIEQVYGVTHGAVDRDIFGRERTRIFLPSEELQGRILALPEGTVVGLETFRELYDPRDASERLDSETHKIIFGLRGEEYWECLVSLCKSRGLTVVYLDDLKTWNQSREKYHEGSKRRSVLSMHVNYEGQEPMGTPLERKQWWDEAYVLDCEGEYLFVFGREEKIAHKIMECGAQVVVVGVGHADAFYLGQIPSTRGVTVGCYVQEVIRDGRQIIIEEVGIDSDYVCTRELVRREYNLATQLRILPERSPDFIGSYSSEHPRQGVFELYLQKGAGKLGICEDGLGTARTEVSFTAGGIDFVKSYDEEWTRDLPHRNMSALPGEIFYSGGLKDGVYRGTWRHEWGHEGDFVLFPGDVFPPEALWSVGEKAP